MRAWLPYYTSAAVHGCFLATLHWAWQGPAPAQYALEAGHAQIELTLSLPLEAAEPTPVEIAPHSEPPAEMAPIVPLQRREADLPSRPLEVAEATPVEEAMELATLRVDAQPDEPPSETPEAPPPPPTERQVAEHALTAAAEATFQPPATAGATVDELPKKLPRNPAPRYPAAAYTARQEGVVLVRVQISPAGLVVDAQLEESSGHPLLDQSALETVRQWQFSPARRAGLAVAHEILVPVRFQLSPRRA